MLPTRVQLQREPWTSCLETWGVPLCLDPEPALSPLGQGDDAVFLAGAEDP